MLVYHNFVDINRIILTFVYHYMLAYVRTNRKVVLVGKSFAVKGTHALHILREMILGGAYFNEGVCDVNHNSLQFSTRILVCTIMRPAVTVPHIDWV